MRHFAIQQLPIVGTFVYLQNNARHHSSEKCILQNVLIWTCVLDPWAELEMTLNNNLHDFYHWRHHYRATTSGTALPYKL